MIKTYHDNDVAVDFSPFSLNELQEDRKTSGSVSEIDFHASGVLDHTRQPSSAVSRGNFTPAITESRSMNNFNSSLFSDRMSSYLFDHASEN